MAATASAVSRLLTAGGMRKSGPSARGGSTEGFWTDRNMVTSAVVVHYATRWSISEEQRVSRSVRAMGEAADILRAKGYTVEAETNPDGTAFLTVTKED